MGPTKPERTGSCYLVLARREGWSKQLTIRRMTKEEPRLDPDEVAVRVTVVAPDSTWDHQRVTVTVPERGEVVEGSVQA